MNLISYSERDLAPPVPALPSKACLTLPPLVPVAAARCLLSSEKAKATLLSRDQREKNPV